MIGQCGTHSTQAGLRLLLPRPSGAPPQLQPDQQQSLPAQLRQHLLQQLLLHLLLQQLQQLAQQQLLLQLTTSGRMQQLRPELHETVVRGQARLAGAVGKLLVRNPLPTESVRRPLQGMALLSARVRSLLSKMAGRVRSLLLGMAGMLRNLLLGMAGMQQGPEAGMAAPEVVKSKMPEAQPLGMAGTAAEQQLQLAKQLMTNSWQRSEQLR